MTGLCFSYIYIYIYIDIYTERETETQTHRGDIYIYIYIYINNTVFNLVNLELGTILSRINKIFKNMTLNSSNPSQELNVNKIHRTNKFLLKKKNKKKNKTKKKPKQLVTKIMNLFLSC